MHFLLSYESLPTKTEQHLLQAVAEGLPDPGLVLSTHELGAVGSKREPEQGVPLSRKRKILAAERKDKPERLKAAEQAEGLVHGLPQRRPRMSRCQNPVLIQST